MRRALLAATTAMLFSSGAMAAQTAVKINLINVGGVEKGTDAFQGFKTAAKFWQDHLTTSQPTVINIRVGFESLGSNILGQTGSAYTSKAVQSVESRIVNRQFGSFDAQASSHLPSLSLGQLGVGALDVYTPGYTGTFSDGSPFGIDNSTKVYDTDGSYNNSVLGLTTANAKALGYNSTSSSIDASITFSSDFAFDFDPKDGIASQQYDFIAVATHEIGHALGFVSGVDDYDVLGTGGPFANSTCLADGTLCQDYPANDDWFGTPLDMFRYSAAGALDWTTNTASYFSVDKGASAYLNGYMATGAYTGDGDQASHWKAPVAPPFCTGLLGIMNPYACSRTNGIVTTLDFAALDAIGWNTKVDVGNNPNIALSTASFQSYVPEPANWAMLIAGFGLTGAAMRRKRHSVVAA